jgi:hypothetical protein
MGFLSSSTQQAQTGTTATIYNIALGAADTEQSQALPTNCKKFVIKTRNSAVLRFAYVTGGPDLATGDYITIKSNAVFTDDNLYGSQTIYWESSDTGDTVEIVAYT